MRRLPAMPWVRGASWSRTVAWMPPSTVAAASGSQASSGGLVLLAPAGAVIGLGLPERGGDVAGPVDAGHLDAFPDAVQARREVDLVADLPVVGGGGGLRDHGLEHGAGRVPRPGLGVAGQGRGPGAGDELGVLRRVGGAHEVDRVRGLAAGHAVGGAGGLVQDRGPDAGERVEQVLLDVVQEGHAGRRITREPGADVVDGRHRARAVGQAAQGFADTVALGGGAVQADERDQHQRRQQHRQRGRQEHALGDRSPADQSQHTTS
jgi:hypothetical protein